MDRWTINAHGGAVELVGSVAKGHHPYLRIESRADASHIVTIEHPATLRRLARLINAALTTPARGSDEQG